MASVHKEFTIEAGPEHVWAAVREFGAVHERLAPGFVADVRVDADTRVVTFADGVIVHERLVDLDDEARRIAYTIVGGMMHTSHHHASVQVFDEGDGRSTVVWHTDVIPAEPAAVIAKYVEEGSEVMRRTLSAD